MKLLSILWPLLCILQCSPHSRRSPRYGRAAIQTPHAVGRHRNHSWRIPAALWPYGRWTWPDPFRWGRPRCPLSGDDNKEREELLWCGIFVYLLKSSSPLFSGIRKYGILLTSELLSTRGMFAVSGLLVLLLSLSWWWSSCWCSGTSDGTLSGVCTSLMGLPWSSVPSWGSRLIRIRAGSEVKRLLINLIELQDDRIPSQISQERSDSPSSWEQWQD